MGSKTIVELYDDIDGSTTDDIRTVSLSLDGKAVELDLSRKNYDKVAEFLAPYIEAGRKTSGGSTGSRRRSTATAPAGGGIDTKAVRAWAEQQGIEVSSRGRISADVLTQYEAAQK